MEFTYPECHPHQGELTTDQATESECGLLAADRAPRPIVQGSQMMTQKRESKSMIQGKEILISGGKFTNVKGDYHEHNTTYVVDARARRSLSLYIRIQYLEKLGQYCLI